MLDFVAETPTWVVLPELAQLIAVEPGQQCTSNQAHELFTDEAAAIERALAVGWLPPPTLWDAPTPMPETEGIWVWDEGSLSWVDVSSP